VAELMFGSVKGVRLEKREERGLVRTGTLRRWGIPIETPRIIPVNAQIPVTTAEQGSCPRKGTLELSTGHAPPLFAL